MNTLHVKKGDSVRVLTGKDRGRTGTILKALPQDGKVVVEGVNVLKKHVRGQGIIEKPMPIDVSNVAKEKETKKKSSSTKSNKSKK